MIYEGRIRLRGEHGNGLEVRLGLDDGTLWLRADGQELGRWPVSKIAAQRLTGDRFSMVIDDEPVLFVAEDPVAFSYEVLPHLRRLTDGTADRPSPSTSPSRRLAGAIPAVLGAVTAAFDLAAASPTAVPARTDTDDPNDPPDADHDLPELRHGPDPVGPATTPSATVTPTEAPREDGPGPVLALVRDDGVAVPGRCEGSTRTGEPCRNRAPADARFCHQHDPRRQAVRRAARIDDPRLRRMQRRVEAAIDAVRDGEMDPAAAHALANLARALCVIARTDALLHGSTEGGVTSDPLEHPRDVAEGRR